MESQPTTTAVSQQTFDIDSSENYDVYRIKLERGQNAEITAKLTQKKFNESEPTCFSLTYAGFYSGIPYGDNLVYNYIDSKVSKEKEISLSTSKSNVNQWSDEIFLIVDGIWKDKKTVEPYMLTIETSCQSEITAGAQNYASNCVITDTVASRCITSQPTRTSIGLSYEGLKGCYKIIDYGNPELSLYGIIIILHRNRTQVIDVMDFDNLQDFYIMGRPEGTTTVPI